MATTQTSTNTSQPKRRRTAKKKAAANGAGSTAATEAAEKIAKAKAEEKAKAEAAKNAKKEAERAKREAERAKRAKEREANKAKVMKQLDKDAQQINHRFAQLDRQEKRTDDVRLATALLIDGAKMRAKEAGIKFQAWCEANLHLPPKEEGGEPRQLSYETIRKLAPIGAAENANEGDGMKMLEDMRDRNAAANRKARESKSKSKGKSESAVPSLDDAKKIVDELTKEDWDKLMASEANAGGMKLVPSDDNEGEGVDEDAHLKGAARLRAGFSRLRGNSKLEFARWVCEQVGWQAEVEADEEEEA